MRAPALRRSTNEIVTEIMEILEAPPVEIFVRKLIDWLRADCPPFIGNRNINDGYLKDLSKQITKFKRLLRSAPAPLSTALFSPELFWPLYVRQGTALGINPSTRDWLAKRNPVRRAFLVELLDRLQAQADEIRRRGLGMHGGVDYRKLCAAIASGDVLEHAATFHPERELSLSCSRRGAYCTIASLFFEAATGEHDCDLRRACKMAAPAPSRRAK
jgi:hypothetical protein